MTSERNKRDLEIHTAFDPLSNKLPLKKGELSGIHSLSYFTNFFLHPDEGAEASLPSIHVQVHLVAPHLETLLDPERVQGECAEVTDALVFAGGQETLRGEVQSSE